MIRQRRPISSTSRPDSSAHASTSDSPSSFKDVTLAQVLAFIRVKLPSISSLIVGVVIGVIFAFTLRSDSDTSGVWRPGKAAKASWAHISSKSHRANSHLPTYDQRVRVFDILTTLTGQHTRQCTRNAQPAYRRQVYERYEPLVGYHQGSGRGGIKGRLGSLFSGGWTKNRNDEEIKRIFRSPRRAAPRSSRLSDLTLDGGASAQASDMTRDGHKYFFAINLYNSFDIIPDLFSTMLKISAILGYHNVFISVYENGSKDQTKALLRLFDAVARSVGLRVVIRTSLRTRGAFNHRIEYLAEVRNAALAPLAELREAEGEVFDSVIFMNDVLPCLDDLMELVWQSRRQNAGITCGADYIFHDDLGSPVFYDNWVARDTNGTALENAPFEMVFKAPESNWRFQRHLPIQVQSCWNGIAVLDPAPLYMHPAVKFRMANLAKGECSASECSLICNDYMAAGYGRIMMVSRVKLAYDKQVFDLTHPARRNLTVIRGYTRLGGTPDDPAADPQDRSWYGPHDRLFRAEESEPIDFIQPPPYVFCWGWEGYGDLDGPDVEPIWEPLKLDPTRDITKVRHDRGFAEL
ncbi:glycosyltransferase family 69 protein [Mixia osmundae IAM 14324]|uniref:Glycosyltransferase family 69 protein n=1 Tax=Mixia osmundae (strain CBS 9802 / IAM 14324 / JCM 22182 / KY 12970) TaxID=764103 RepID=G7E5Z4_MIXOS|nr:glycosyltransferase family 69 protein [Mixia osmundae IAM 14324]KEI40596.1 glycosyltransferase family 69 protein [Mixia osmundae IAM 14324]GAA98254.1 hypothetical protein E5Q_04937 [Mixia osmundae IAM 14324]